MTMESHASTKSPISLLERWFRGSASPVSWAAAADRLHRAAEHLFVAQSNSWAADGAVVVPEDNDLHEPATLLYALAIENAVKGALVELRSLRAEEYCSIAGWRQHNLSKLVKQSGITTNQQQMELLDGLTAVIKWAGRYPVPLDRNDFLLWERPADSGPVKRPPPCPLSRHMREILNPLYQDLMDRIVPRCRNSNLGC